ncbi:alpha-L-rhamnosidase-related protein [Microbacterium hibisci]|uniref:alpha-L-rhamnosidase-related protein n=1 Tax=Microbacterium hibisci TaxID=2036000 RepID=UPI0019418AE3|nr:alpha-L-rhamnosidase C-terminal domain-containing protein [Microbacterium hibisci]
MSTVDDRQTPAAERPHRDRLRDDLLRLSRSAGADRLPDEVARPTGRQWLYAAGDYESAALARVVAEGHAANRFVDYALNFAEPGSHARFRAEVPAALPVLRLSATGRARVLVDGGEQIFDLGAFDLGAGIEIPGLAAGATIEVRVDSAPGEPPALGVADDGATPLIWHSSRDGEEWTRAAGRTGGDEPPHLLGEGEVEVPMTEIAPGLYAAPAPLLGRVVVHAQGRPTLVTGESVDEALADPAFGESDFTLDETTAGEYRSRHRLGLRFARITGADVSAVAIHAAVRPAAHRGAFVTADPTLNAVWATSSYTLRLCLQTFLIDGIKRDRMPWIGDHALGVLTNAYAFADAGIIRDTLTALGRPRHGYINGIADYSLWWVISQGLYQRFFDDRDYLDRESAHIDAFLADLATHAADDGVLRPARLPDSFAQAGPGSLFLDWGVTLNPDGDATAVQILWFWALRSGAEVLAKAGHDGAARWADLAERVRAMLLARAWSAHDGCWREYLDHDGQASAYPNFLAALAGLTADETAAPSDRRADIVATTAAGTPFMRSFALLALGRLGRRQQAVAELRRLWGRMIDAGAATFWEEFTDAAASPYEMYRRPYGKSLCHAWSAGPAAVLPQLVLGLAPLTDGWREFTVDPELGDLPWAGAVVPVPHGDIVVLADSESVVVDVPAGTTLVAGAARHHGPARVELPAPRPSVPA